MEENQLLDSDFSKPFAENLQPVNQGLRFLNYFIDYIALSVISQFLLTYGVFSGLAYYFISSVDNYFSALLFRYIFYSTSVILYYVPVEQLTGGRSLGKLITGTRAIRQDGGTITLRDTLLRSFSRIVPFEHLSFLASRVGWHDSWSNTMVVSNREYRATL